MCGDYPNRIYLIPMFYWPNPDFSWWFTSVCWLQNRCNGDGEFHNSWQKIWSLQLKPGLAGLLNHADSPWFRCSSGFHSNLCWFYVFILVGKNRNFQFFFLKFQIFVADIALFRYASQLSFAGQDIHLQLPGSLEAEQGAEADGALPKAGSCRKGMEIWWYFFARILAFRTHKSNSCHQKSPSQWSVQGPKGHQWTTSRSTRFQKATRTWVKCCGSIHELGKKQHWEHVRWKRGSCFFCHFVAITTINGKKTTDML